VLCKKGYVNTKILLTGLPRITYSDRNFYQQVGLAVTLRTCNWKAPCSNLDLSFQDLTTLLAILTEIFPGFLTLLACSGIVPSDRS
jgi:hypothetical protein